MIIILIRKKWKNIFIPQFPKGQNLHISKGKIKNVSQNNLNLAIYQVHLKVYQEVLYFWQKLLTLLEFIKVV